MLSFAEDDESNEPEELKVIKEIINEEMNQAGS